MKDEKEFSTSVVIGRRGAYPVTGAGKIHIAHVLRALLNNEEELFQFIRRWDVFMLRFKGLGHSLNEPARTFYFEQIESARESL